MLNGWGLVAATTALRTSAVLLSTKAFARLTLPLLVGTAEAEAAEPAKAAMALAHAGLLLTQPLHLVALHLAPLHLFLVIAPMMVSRGNSDPLMIVVAIYRGPSCP